MTTTLDHKVTVRFFIGTPINAALRLHLSQSLPWKESKIHRQSDDALQEAHHHSKEYLGVYFSGDFTTLPLLRELQGSIVAKIKTYCPNMEDVDSMSFFIFPQLFIA